MITIDELAKAISQVETQGIDAVAKAWLAHTGFPPDQAELVRQITGEGVRIWIQRRSDLPCLPAADTRDAARYRGLVTALLNQDESFFARVEEVCPALTAEDGVPTLEDWNAALDKVLGLEAQP